MNTSSTKEQSHSGTEPSSDRKRSETPQFQKALAESIQAVKDQDTSRRPRATGNGKMRNDHGAVASVFEKLIASNPEASHAVQELRHGKLVLPGLKLSAHEELKIHTLAHYSDQKILDNPMTAVVEIKHGPFPHMDAYGWGNQSQYEANKSNGFVAIYGGCGGIEIPDVPVKDDDHLEGGAAVMDLITTDSFALVTVEALMWNKWQYGVQAHGVGSHADVEGGISYGANRLWPLIPRRRDALFDDFANDFNQVEHTGTGMMTARMDFTLEGAGDFAIVDFGVYLKCNHDSGVGAFGVSLGSAGAGGFVSALVQELRITKVIP